MIDLLKKHKILIRYLIVILSVLGIISQMYIQKINDEKPYKPQHELDWYYEVMSEYFDNISVEYQGQVDDIVYSNTLIYYFSDKPGISALLSYNFVDNAFDENSELRSDLDHIFYVRMFSQAVNELYYASLVYDDFVDYINSIIPEGMNYKLGITLSTHSNNAEIVEFTPEAAWTRLRNEDQYFLLFWLVETDDEYEEFDLQESLNELLQYTMEYFKSREVMLAIFVDGAEMENIDEYQEYLLRQWFNRIDSLSLNGNVQDESQ